MQIFSRNKIMHHPITNTILRHYKISMEELRSKSRKADLVEARQVICYFLYQRLDISLAKIGAIILRDHSTVLHSVKKVQEYIETYKHFRERLEKIEKDIDKKIKILYVTIPIKEYEELKSLATKSDTAS